MRSPANSKRRRAPKTLMSTLAKTPPRPSYADKVKGIFTDAPSPNHEPVVAQSLDHNGAIFTRGSPPPQTSSSSTLTSESELEKRLTAAHHSPIQRNNTPVATSPTSNIPSRANVSHASGAIPPDEQRNIPQIQVPNLGEESSSEAWTDDDIFYPRHIRRQNKMLQRRRELQRIGNLNGGYPMPPAIIEEAQRHRETRELLASSPFTSPKLSRFRPTMPAFVPRHTRRESGPGNGDNDVDEGDGSSMKLERKDTKGPINNRSSDADDEADSDPDA